MDLKYQKTVGQTHQDRRPFCPGQMDICLVSEDVAPFGRPLGAVRSLPHAVVGRYCDPYLELTDEGRDTFIVSSR